MWGHRKRSHWDYWAYAGIVVPLTLIWLAAKLWPNSLFKHWEQFITDKIETPALMVSIAVAPFLFIVALIRTARAKNAEDRERYRTARGECAACGFNLSGVATHCPICGKAVITMAV